ncbi:RCC1 domain-containing protein [Vallitalea maricola]|uniref:Uncharacterized protein n=1 Tax=Vallitalea maricola TaxID=3074433 RepID=A0ACB5UE31_9FIRM|nr:hypothetical protein AN2V17_02340 [Vallitalea sp. AN17-2]
MKIIRKNFSVIIYIVICVILYSKFKININVYAQDLAEGYIDYVLRSNHTIALKNDGTVWAWGANHDGKLGDGTTIGKNYPVQVIGLTNIETIIDGDGYTFVLKNDGTVWAWGANHHGQLGDGTTTNRLIPIQIKRLTNIKNIIAGGSHTIALKNDGTVWAWGANNNGQLGDGTRIDRLTPVQIKGLTGVKTIAVNWYRNIALKYDGTVWGWGKNENGELGDGTTTDRLIPMQIKELTNVKSIVINWFHSIALKNDGTVWGWGKNDQGQLGDGTTTDRLTPVQTEILTNVKTIAADMYHNIALKNDGTVWAWGGNGNGQLGDGTLTGDRIIPVQVKNLLDIKSVQIGSDYCIALRNDGTVWAWGINSYGQLGDGTKKEKAIPVQILTDVIKIAVGSDNAIAIKRNGTVLGWGSNYWGELGNGINARSVLNPTYIYALYAPNYPQQPQNISVIPKISNINLSWLTALNAINYTVKRATTSGGEYTILAENITSTTFIDKNVVNGKTYYYVVSAVNNGISIDSSEVSATFKTIVPTIPTNVSTTSASHTIKLSWDSVTGAESYIIKRSTISGSEYTVVADNITETTYTDEGVSNGTTYYYVVVSKNEAGESGNATEVTAKPKEPITVPTAPTNVNATGDNKRVVLNWDKVTGAESYIIKRSTTSGSEYTVVADNITETTYTDEGVSNGTTYYYVVVSKNEAGESGNSTEVTAKPKEPITVPTAPTNVNATGDNKRVVLNWDKVTGAESYIIKRSTTLDDGYTAVASNITTLNYTDTNLTNGTTYYYIIVAKNKAGESDNSAQVSAVPNSKPLAPTNLSAISNDLSIKLRWGSVSDADSYIIRRKSISESNYQTIATDITTTTYTDTGLNNGKTYFYVVLAKNEVGESANSDEISVIPLNGPPAIPTNLIAESSNESVNLTWSNTNGAFTYKIKRATTSGGPYTLVANNITGTTYKDTGLTNGTSYYYVVSAVNTKGESANSTEVISLPDITKPNSPTGINVSTADKRVNLTWNKIVNADSYIVKKATTSGGPYTIVANNLTKTTYTELGLNNGTSYYYIIIAKNEKGESEPSIEKEAVPGIQKPNNVIIQVVDKEIKLSWDPVSNTDVYKIKRSENLDGPYTVLSEGITGTNYVDNSIKENKLYYYVISAVKSLGESPETEPVSALVKDSVDKRYILLVVLNNGMQKEYDVDTSTAVKFINWYLNRANGIGSPFFTLFNQEKEDVFENSKDYIGFNTILYYQLNEYKVYMQK